MRVHILSFIDSHKVLHIPNLRTHLVELYKFHEYLPIVLLFPRISPQVLIIVMLDLQDKQILRAHTVPHLRRGFLIIVVHLVSTILSIFDRVN